jgi:hypothetical protein
LRMVRCFLRSPGDAPSLRFVPRREFYLWKYFMTHRHGKIVDGEDTSIWVDADTYGSAPPSQAMPLEAVVRVDLQHYNARSKQASLVQRYFPLDEYDSIKDKFLNHFPDSTEPSGRIVMRRRVREIKGWFIHPRVSQASA